MKFLIDEDVPVAVMGFLRSLGHEVTRVAPSTPDTEVARLAKSEGSIVVTLDKDFTNMALFPPKEFNIVHIQIHPPIVRVINEALRKLIETSDKSLSGLMVLRPDGHTQYL